jgi:hypothetical protein
MRHNNDDIQGRALGVMPYDFRLPTVAKVLRRLYQPGGPMFVPKVFGAGWTLNFANRRTWYVIGALSAFGIITALVC